MQISSGAEKVRFAVPLMDMNINKMVLGAPADIHKDYLQIIYPVGKKYASTPPPPRLKLMSTTELRALFSTEDVKLRSWLDAMQVTCMAEYLPLLEESLQKQIFCRKAIFLASSGSFVFLFPKQQPALMLQSSQHISLQGIPKKSPLLSEYPWSPRWEASRMAERIFDFLADEALNFKRFCSESQPQQ
ncbi:hypothetical protein F3Y22_tig00002840pilonHSYRG01217 [Hibiscus syriacus]|uniref:BRISC and BRCA1-A complex member 2 n=1 Tax=Hibiscus syriacus TaxID=106335 RepID=A0A6A3CQD3_HIBSY|nr:hypothetical protein F3Y22_tig00002840pilonHSYRG01217 [Hibiscus syriacus]